MCPETFQYITIYQVERQCEGRCLKTCFENHINNQREKLINKAGTYGLRFQGDVATTKGRPLLDILDGGGSPICASTKYFGLYRSYHRRSQEGC